MKHNCKINNKKITDQVEWAGSTLKNRLFLAPMAGPGALAFRKVCARFGAALCVTELASARAIRYSQGLESNKDIMAIKDAQPSSIQLFTFDPQDLAYAVPKILADPRYEAVGSIDINMGCPVKKVVKTGAGAALMRTPDLAAKLVETAVKAAAPYKKQITVKFRSGWDAEHLNAPHFAKLMQEAGASAICLHARTREQMYSGTADWQMIAECKAVLSIPLAGNGDIKTVEDCEKILNTYGADACAIGRAALGQPWIFSRLLAESRGEQFEPPSGEAWQAVIFEHYHNLREQYGAEHALQEFKSSLAYYLKGIPKAAALRNKAMRLENEEDFYKLLGEIVDTSQAE